MTQKNTKTQSKVEILLTVTADTYERILNVCKKFQVNPGRYIDALVDYDQHLPPQERLAMELDLMLMDAAVIGDDSDDGDSD